jgi:hypothetical protein
MYSCAIVCKRPGLRDVRSLGDCQMRASKTRSVRGLRRQTLLLFPGNRRNRSLKG